MSRKQAFARAAELIDMVALSQRADHKPVELSGGEQQRVAIARALINRPSVVLADEPTGNLDPVTADEIMQLFKQITAKGCAIIMSTHNTALIEQYPARTVMFAKGHISEIDLQRSFTE
jgi:cell division transport system ATP-binding protein